MLSQGTRYTGLDVNATYDACLYLAFSVTLKLCKSKHCHVCGVIADILSSNCRLANHGADAFYTGEIADNIVKAATARGGIITHEDLEGYQVVIRTPNNISTY